MLISQQPNLMSLYFALLAPSVFCSIIVNIFGVSTLQTLLFIFVRIFQLLQAFFFFLLVPANSVTLLISNSFVCLL